MALTSAAFVKQAAIAALLLATLTAAGAADEAASCASEAGADAVGEALGHHYDQSEGVSLIALKSKRTRKPSSTNLKCGVLQNRETHFTVDVRVGTPAQIFSLVADTGSNSLIVTSCLCKEAGYCEEENRCFTGTNKSDTFHYDPKNEEMVLTFGSGQIQAAEAVDVVQVAGVKANMTDGILLMTDQQLDFGGPFEGILGLGPPLPEKEEDTIEITGSGSESGSIDVDGLTGDASDIWKKIFDNAIGGGGIEGLNATTDSASASDSSDTVMARKGRGLGLANKTKRMHQPIGFLEQANISRFALCFNPGSDGVLRLGTPEHSAAHIAVGSEHWGLGLEGISVGDNESIMIQAIQATKANGSAQGAEKRTGPGALCSKESMKDGQLTPCGAIPDSGTTQIMAPQTHIDALYEAICDQWPRCKSNYTSLMKAVKDAEQVIVKEYTVNPFEFKVQGKGEVLNMLLNDCANWMTDGGVDELPPVHFHVAGNSSSQKVTIPARSWLVETKQEEQETEYQHVDGFGDVAVGTKGTGKEVKVCVPSFGAMEYETQQNGPVWILGTPVFYEYVVGYDLAQKSISLISQQEEACGTCDQKVGFLASRPSLSARSGALRTQLKQPRLPNIDVKRPL